MKRVLVFLPILLNIFILINSCKDSNQKKISEKTVGQGVIKKIPKDRYGRNYPYYNMVQEFTKDADLNSLNDGFDSMFIRIWYAYRSTLQVIDLKKDAIKWEGEYHSMEIDLIKDTFQAVNIKTQQIHPKSGWDSFTKNLFSLNILNMPHQSELSGYGGGDADGTSITVEVATKKSYRIYSYTDPMVHLEFPQAATMEKIMELIEDELDVKRNEKF